MSLVSIEPVAGEIQGSLQTRIGAARPNIHGFVRTLNLAGAPLHGLFDYFVVNVFR
jgi:hypothetical protein